MGVQKSRGRYSHGVRERGSRYDSPLPSYTPWPAADEQTAVRKFPPQGSWVLALCQILTRSSKSKRWFVESCSRYPCCWGRIESCEELSSLESITAARRSNNLWMKNIYLQTLTMLYIVKDVVKLFIYPVHPSIYPSVPSSIHGWHHCSPCR